MGAFDDLIPQGNAGGTPGVFDDLIPAKAETKAGAFDDLIPKAALAEDPHHAEIRQGEPPSWWQDFKRGMRERATPLLGPTEDQVARDSVEIDGQRVYKPFGGAADQMGLIPALSRPTVPIDKLKSEAAPGDSTAMGVTKAVGNVALDFGGFMLSPLGIATAGVGSLAGAPGAAINAGRASAIVPEVAEAAMLTRNLGRVVAGGYALDMGAKIPEAARAAGEASVNGTTQAKAETLLQLGVNAFLVPTLASHALKGVPGTVVRTEERRVVEPTVAPELSEFGGEGRVQSSEVQGSKPGVFDDLIPATGKDSLQVADPTLREFRTVEPAVSERPEEATLRDSRTVEPTDHIEETLGMVEPTSVLAQYPVVETPLKELSLSKDVPNFKADADAATGVVEGQQLQGKYERLGTGAITVWERADGSKEVISGRHRFDLAKRAGEKTIPSQIVREAEGFTKEMAQTLDAEMNIRDGQGTTADYANYFRHAEIAPEEAVARGLTARAKGRAGWLIGRQAGEDLYALYRSGKVNEGQAAAIAQSAPWVEGDALAQGLQRVGAKAALDGKGAQEIANYLQAVRLETKALPAEQFDLFAADDSALRQAEQMAKVASRIQTELARQIKATDNAARAATTAKARGIRFERAPETILAENAQLRGERDRWDNWSLHPELVQQVRDSAEMERTQKAERPGNAVLDQIDRLKIDTRGQVHAFGLLPEAWNTLLDLVKLGVRGGMALKDAVQSALAQFKQKNPGVKFDEAGATRYLMDPNKRAFGEKVLASEDISPEVKAGVTEYNYLPRANETDLQTAKRLIAERGPDAAAELFRNPPATLPGAVQSALGKALILDLATQEKVARASGNKILSDELAEKQVSLIDHDLKRSTDVAQSLQAMRLFGDMSPTAVVRQARRSIEEAGTKAWQRVLPAVQAVRDELTAGNAEAVQRTIADPAVNRAARAAVDAAVVASPEVHRGIVMELAEPFAQSPAILKHAREAVRERVNALMNTGGRPPNMRVSDYQRSLMNDLAKRAAQIANGHYQGAEPGVVLKDKLMQRLGIGETQAKTLARQLDMEFAKMVERAKGKLHERVAMQRARREAQAGRPSNDAAISHARSVWSREKQAASVALVKAAAGAKGTSARTPIQEFAGRLTQVLREKLTPPGANGAPKLTDLQILREAIENSDKYLDVWTQARNDITTTLFEKDPRRLQELGDVLGQAVPELFRDTTVDRVIREQLRAHNLKLGDVVRQEASAVDAARRQLGDRVVAASGLAGPKAEVLREAFNRRFTELAATAKRQRLEALGRSGVRVPAKVKQTYQQLIELTNLGAFADQTVFEHIAKKLEIPQVTDAMAKDIIRQVNDLQALPEGFQRQRATLSLMDYIAKQKGLNWWDLPVGFYYANILSSPLTHLANVIGNASNLAALTAIQTGRNPLAAPQVLRALGRGFGKGGTEALSVLRSGQVTGTRLKSFEAGNALELTKFTGLATPLNGWKYVARALAAEDMFFYKAAEEMRSTAVARTLAKREGLTGSALQARTDEIVGNLPARVAAAEAQARTEGLRGLDFRRRVAEIIEQSRPEALRETARDYALRATFNGDPYGLIGVVARAMNAVNRQAVVTRAVVPFVNVVANVMNEGLNYTPVGAGRALWGHFKGELEEQWAKAAVGTVLLSALAAATSESLTNPAAPFAVTGSGPRDKNQRAQLKGTGWLPNALKIGDRYYSYANTPLAIPLAILGNYQDALRYKKLGEQDAANRAAYVLGQSGQVILQQGFLDSLDRALQLLHRDSPAKAGTQLADFVGRSASSLVVPNALRMVDRVFDPTVYESDTVQGAVAAQLPFVRREGRPALNVFGEPVRNPVLDRFTTAALDDPLLRTLAAKDVWISVPDRLDLVVEGKKRDGEGNYRVLTPEEFYTFMQRSGPAIRAALSERLEVLQELEPPAARKQVQKIVQQERERALAEFR